MAHDYHYDGENAWDEDDEEEEEEQKQGPDSNKEKLIFLIDVQDSMFEEIPWAGETMSCFEAARRAVVQLIKLKAIQSPDDSVAVILYNTREKDPPGGGGNDAGGGGGGGLAPSFEGVFTLLELQQPSAEAVKAVRDLTEESFRSRIGGLPARRDSCLAEALFRVQACLAASGSAERSFNTLVLFSNDQEPAGSASSPGYRAAISQLSGRVEALQGYRLRLRFFPLAAAVRPFDSGRLWRALLRALRGAGPGAAAGAGDGGGGGDGGEAAGDADDDEAVLRELAREPADRRDPVSAVVSLFDSFRRRLARKRTAMRLRWQISERLGVALKGYLLISDAYKAARRTLPLNPVTNQPLKITTTFVATSDGRVLEREDVTARKRFRLKTGNVSRVPEVSFPASEVSPASLLRPGLVLLGFKPLSCLGPHLAMRAPVFLRPDEAAAPGSTAAFIALWRAMLAEGRFALCRYKRANSAPQHVALVAQDEQLDVYGLQTEPPGMHMHYLPYMDDVRHPENAAGVLPPALSDEQMGAARALVAALQLGGPGEGGGGGGGDEVGGGGVVEVSNPALQRHYQVIESLALSEPLPEWRAVEDDPTRPRRELFSGPDAAAAAEAFRAAFPQDAGGGRRSGAAKRRAEGEPGPAAAAKAARAEAVADAYEGIDWAAKLRAGELAKLTKDELTIYLRRHQLKVSGKKDDLVARVAEHLAAGGAGGA